jgi:hypothetical protein
MVGYVWYLLVTTDGNQCNYRKGLKVSFEGNRYFSEVL